MPRDLFARPSRDCQTRRNARLLPLSIALHVVALGALVIVPLLATGELPGVPDRRMVAVLATAPPPPPPPDIVVRLKPRPDARPPVPTSTPVDRPVSPSGDTPSWSEGPVARGPATGIPMTSVFGTGQPVGGLQLPGPAASGSGAPPSGPVRPGGDIERPRKVRHVAPEYPAIARAVGKEGTVVIDAIIGPDGRVQQATVRESSPLFDRAALEAVRQWVYTPTRLNDVPVAVIMSVEVRFTLAR